jgi:YVTN family beta-propeller protein
VADIIIGVFENPFAIDINPNTNTIYVATWDSDTVSVIDGKTDSVTANITVQSPNAITVNPNTNTIYVANRDSNTVTVIDGKTDSVLEDINLSGSPSSLAIDLKTNVIYVCDQDIGTLSLIQPKTEIPKNVEILSTNPYLYLSIITLVIKKIITFII